jgi:hypothetical protein
MKPFLWLLTVLTFSLMACNPSNPVTSAPIISSFSAGPSSINAGGSSTLSWVVAGTTPISLSLNQGLGSVSGSSKIVSPSSTISYTLTAQNSVGTVTQSVSVAVLPVVNVAPTVSSMADLGVSLGVAAQNLDLKTKFSDAEDGTNLTYSASSSNSSIVSTSLSNGVLNLIFGSVGSATITTTAKDSGNLSVSTNFLVTVNAALSSSPCDHFLQVTANTVNKQKGYPDPVLTATCTASSFTVFSNGIPNFEFVRSNPSDLAAQSYSFSLPRNPTFAASTTAVPLGGSVAVAINGLPIFGPTENPMDGYKDPYLNGILDYCNGHPAQRGDYHFHARPDTTGCIADSSKVGQVLAFAFDGFPIVAPVVCTNAACTSTKKMLSSWRVKAGVNAQTTAAWDAHEFVLGLGDLDQCNGYTRDDGSYVYVATDAFPYFIGCYKGTPTIPAPPR